MNKEEEDIRMACFLQSKDYKEETWMTEEIQYIRWVNAGRPQPYNIVEVEGFKPIHKD